MHLSTPFIANASLCILSRTPYKPICTGTFTGVASDLKEKKAQSSFPRPPHPTLQAVETEGQDTGGGLRLGKIWMRLCWDITSEANELNTQVRRVPRFCMRRQFDVWNVVDLTVTRLTLDEKGWIEKWKWEEQKESQRCDRTVTGINWKSEGCALEALS